MRILLDEDLPRRLAAMLIGHEVSIVEFQQDLTTLPIAVLVVEAVINRMEHLVPIVPGILKELSRIPPRSLRKIGA